MDENATYICTAMNCHDDTHANAQYAYAQYALLNYMKINDCMQASVSIMAK